MRKVLGPVKAYGSTLATKPVAVTAAALLFAALLVRPHPAGADMDFYAYVSFSGASNTERAIWLKTDYSPGTGTIILYRDNLEYLRHDVASPDVGGSVTLKAYVPDKPMTEDITKFHVRTVTGDSELAVSAPVTIYPRNFRPLAPRLYLKENKLVGAKWAPSGRAGRRNAYVKVFINGRQVYDRPVAAGKQFYFPARKLVYGRNIVRANIRNAWGRSNSVTYPIWNLGSAPGALTFLLVDKSDFRLYQVKRRVVIASFPVGIGTSKSPTPTGNFLIGPRKRTIPTSRWGNMRISLLRKATHRFSGRFIHGTVRPTLVGRRSTRGHVVLYNFNITLLARSTSKGTLVKIRN